MHDAEHGRTSLLPKNNLRMYVMLDKKCEASVGKNVGGNLRP